MNSWTRHTPTLTERVLQKEVVCGVSRRQFQALRDRKREQPPRARAVRQPFELVVRATCEPTGGVTEYHRDGFLGRLRKTKTDQAGRRVAKFRLRNDSDETRPLDTELRLGRTDAPGY